MATVKQRKAVERMLENAGNVSKSMREAGYAPGTAKNPRELTTSRGFMELCDEMGLTDELILGSLAADIKAKPKQRVQELALAARIKGMEKTPTGGGVNFIQILLNAYDLTNEGGDARETDESLPSASESQTQA